MFNGARYSYISLFPPRLKITIRDLAIQTRIIRQYVGIHVHTYKQTYRTQCVYTKLRTRVNILNKNATDIQQGM